MADNANGFWWQVLSPRGRNNRGRFWAVAVLSAMAGIVGSFAVGLLAGMLGVAEEALLFALPLVIAMYGIGFINRIRRLHDLGFSGWWMLLIAVIEWPLTLIAYVPMEDGAPNPTKGLLALFTLTMLVLFGAVPGQSRPNRFGDPPVRAATAEQPA